MSLSLFGGLFFHLARGIMAGNVLMVFIGPVRIHLKGDIVPQLNMSIHWQGCGHPPLAVAEIKVDAALIITVYLGRRVVPVFVLGSITMRRSPRRGSLPGGRPLIGVVISCSNSPGFTPSKEKAKAESYKEKCMKPCDSGWGHVILLFIILDQY
jgi:hypothetical protein